MHLLIWYGVGAMGLTWGWLLGIWAHPRSSNTADRRESQRGRLPAFWRRVTTVVIWLIAIVAPAIEVYLFLGLQPVLLYIVSLGIGWGGFRTWLYILRTQKVNDG